MELKKLEVLEAKCNSLELFKDCKGGVHTANRFRFVGTLLQISIS